ncbi:MAG: sugar phosphate isomerase/epimerase [Deltaproteobacteria bacterium]|nr:sugar phosphate isomerase/epimerase [Deltaproteobacteria bacterium]
MAITAAALKSQVQVNIPFPYLGRGYLELFLELGLNPEIGLFAYPLDHYAPAAFHRAARAFEKAGRRITLHAPFQDLLPGALDDAILAASRRRLRQAWRYLPVFRPVAVVCHLGYEACCYGGDIPQWLARAAATWKELATRAAASGVTVMLENVYETEPDLHLEIIRRVDAPNLKVCLDIGHLYAFGGGDWPRWLHTLAPVIGQLHLHDNHGADDEHLALGAGTIPVAEILQFLADRQMQPLITLEPHHEGSLLPSLDFLAQIWPW